jgi:acyl carrier protein
MRLCQVRQKSDLCGLFLFNLGTLKEVGMSEFEKEPPKLSQRTAALNDPEQIQQAISAQQTIRPASLPDFVAPATPIEKKLAEIWAEALGLEQVGIHDDFFELGGHSLLATQILSRVSHEFQLELPMELIFTTQFTIAELSKAIAKLQIEQADPQTVEALLEKLSQLSEEEARQLLARQAEG